MWLKTTKDEGLVKVMFAGILSSGPWRRGGVTVSVVTGKLMSRQLKSSLLFVRTQNIGNSLS